MTLALLAPQLGRPGRGNKTSVVANFEHRSMPMRSWDPGHDGQAPDNRGIDRLKLSLTDGLCDFWSGCSERWSGWLGDCPTVNLNHMEVVVCPPKIIDLLGKNFNIKYRFRDLCSGDMYRVAERTWSNLGTEGCYTSDTYQMCEGRWESDPRDMYAVVAFTHFSFEEVELSDGTLNSWMPDRSTFDVQDYLTSRARDGL